ncbi:MAG TPA: zinc-dependent metalloprotease [Woeseiaceae bacterium]|nr:zinc-dependent metalloprotease [Woeseiaceae bacterium]
MSKIFPAGLVLGLLVACSAAPVKDNSVSIVTTGKASLSGFIDLAWDESTGHLMFEPGELDAPFIYQSSLAQGLGSNDIGLDRGQLGATRIVRFVRSGPRILLVQDNLDYRAQSDDVDERNAVRESFAKSVIWGFEIVSENGDSILVDGTEFFLRDAHGLSEVLARREEGDYQVDMTRSAIYMPRTRAFPDNTEVEAIVTYTGRPTGNFLPTIAPDASSITVHSHHSFIRLPEDGYEPLPYDPRAGVIGLTYEGRGFIDYAAPIGAPMFVNFGQRHRLQKKNPGDEFSAAVEPIIYYVDRGAPEPIRSALIEGASWWNQAFEAAGYRDAFQVRELPEGADPMDVRYNVIQWVHRSTRGWSYGSSVMDPRTGEILKGHVTLGSLRVRQDYMIAEGLLAPYASGPVPDTMLNMSLARIRQLAAHEVGHTIGFEHNFAASTQGRASVMDYPVPQVRFDADGSLDLSDAYGVGVGSWDKRAVLYAYQDFAPGVDDASAREEILESTIASGLKYVADADSRPVGSAHPDGNLWDNGADAIAELDHLLKVRKYALERFSENNIRIGQPDATLEEALVPIYLLHRFQVQAVGKLIGGVYFDYSLRDARPVSNQPVAAARQQQAIDALLATLRPELLALPDSLVQKIPPRPPGFPRSREAFSSPTGASFDPLAPAASSVALTLDVLLNPQRAARMNREGSPDFMTLMEQLLAVTWFSTADRKGQLHDIELQSNMLVLDDLIRLSANTGADDSVRAVALSAIQRIYDSTEKANKADTKAAARLRLARFRIEHFWSDPASVESIPAVTVPPGSPIGSTYY